MTRKKAVVGLALLRKVQLIWSILLLLVPGLLLLTAERFVPLMIGIILVVYMVATVSCYCNLRRPWIVSFFVPLIVTGLFLPQAVGCIYLSMTEPGYMSRNTDSVVFIAVQGVYFFLPACLICFLYVVEWRRLLAILIPSWFRADKAPPVEPIDYSPASNANPYQAPRHGL